MTEWHDYLNREGKAPPWPYPVDYEKETEVETDVLVIGGGIAGCWAAISAARKGVRVALVEKGDTIRSGAQNPARGRLALFAIFGSGKDHAAGLCVMARGPYPLSR